MQKCAALLADREEVSEEGVQGNASLTQDSGEHSDACAVCGDRGELMLCDGCPRAVHLRCTGLEAVPPGAWYCTACHPAQQRDKPHRPTGTGGIAASHTRSQPGWKQDDFELFI